MTKRENGPPDEEHEVIHEPPWVVDANGNELVRLVDGEVEYASGHDATSVAKALTADPHLAEWFAGLLEGGDA